MKDFLDVLLEHLQQPKASLDEAVYLNRLRSLATQAPSRRYFLHDSSDPIALALSLQQDPEHTVFSARPEINVFFYSIGADAAEPRWFRLAKAKDESRAFGRIDPVHNEAQVLETIAMGADIYSLAVGEHDDAALQYLAEVGHDYAVPVLLRCTSDEDLARAVFVQAETVISLEGVLATPELLELEIFKGRRVLMKYAPGNGEVPIPFNLKQLILHLEPIEEPRT